MNRILNNIISFRIFNDADAEGFSELYALYRSVFPNDDEAEDIDGIRASLALVNDVKLIEKYGPFKEYWIEAVINGIVVGGINFTIFFIPRASINTVHINYLFTSPDNRSKGVGSRLLQKVMELSDADYLFCEQDAPEKMNEEELARDYAASGITAKDRIRWWHKRGFGRLDLNYIQPPLSPEKNAAEGMSLNICPNTGHVSSTIVEEHLRRFFYISVLKKKEGEDAQTEKLLSSVLKIGDTIAVLH